MANKNDLNKLPQLGFLYDTINKIIDNIRYIFVKIDLLQGDIDLDELENKVETNTNSISTLNTFKTNTTSILTSNGITSNSNHDARIAALETKVASLETSLNSAIERIAAL